MAETRSVEVVLSVKDGDFKRGMQSASREVSNLGKSVDSASSRMGQVGSTMAKIGAVATGGLAAGIGAAVKSAADFDEKMSAVSSTGADAKKNLDALREASLKAGADTKYSATEAAAGTEAMLKAGQAAKDVYSGGLLAALNLAASGNMGVADSADTVATAMNNFGLKGNEAARVADAIAAGANKAQGDVSDMAKALEYVSIPARDMGLSVEQTVGAISQLASAGIVGEKAGTSMRSVLMSLTSPSKAAKKTMEELGLSLYDGQGKFKGYQSAVQQLHDKLGPLKDETRDAALGQIFGNEAISAARILMKGGSKEADQWTKAVSEQGYAAKMAAEKMNNAKGDFEQFTGSIETGLIKIGSSAQGPLRTALQDATKTVNELFANPEGIERGVAGIVNGLAGVGKAVGDALKWFGSLSPAMQELIVKGAAVAAIGTTVGGGLLKGVSGAMQFGKSVADLTGALGRVKRGKVDDLAGALDGVAGRAGGAKSVGTAVDGIGSAADRSSGKVGKLGTAIGTLAGAAAISQLGEAAFGKTEVEADRLTTALQGTAKGSAEAKARLDDLIQSGISENWPWQDKIKGTADAFRLFNEQQGVVARGFDAVNGGLKGLSGGLIGIDTQTDDLRKSFGEMDKALAGMSANDSAAVFKQMAKEAQDAHVPLDQLKSLFPEYAASVEKAAGAAGHYNLSTEQMVAAMSGDMPGRMISTADAARKMSDALYAMPDSKTLELIVKDASAATTVDAFMAKVKGLPPVTVAELKAIAQTQGLDAAKAKLAEIQDKQVTLTAKGEHSGADQTVMVIQNAQGKQITLTANGDPSGAKATQAFVTNAQGKKIELVATGNAEGAKGALAVVKGADGKTIYLHAKGDAGGAREALGVMNSANSKTVTLTTVHHTVYTVSGSAPGPATMRYSAEADGGVLEFYAGGGLRENHVAQIAPAGTWRVWAEDETGGEAYIPLAASKRARSLSILEEVARRFGKAVVPNANGNVFSSQRARPVSTTQLVRIELGSKSTKSLIGASVIGPIGSLAKSATRASSGLDAVWRNMQSVEQPLAQLGTAMSQASSAANALAKAQRDNAAPAKLAAAAAGSVKSADAAKDALNASQRAEDLRLAQSILDAQRALARAKSTKSKSDDKVAQSKLTSLQQAKKQVDIRQGREMAAATAKLTAAQKAKSAADDKAKSTAEALKAATDKNREAQQALAQVQKELAQAADSASTGLQQAYRSGDTLDEYVANSHRGALTIAELGQTMAKLSSAGLSKQVQQDLYAKAPDVALSIAKQIASGGQSAIKRANLASSQLDRYGDLLGWQQATGTVKAGITGTELAQLRAQVAADARAATTVTMSAEMRRLAQVISQLQPVQITGADPALAAAKVVSYRNDQLTRAGIR